MLQALVNKDLALAKYFAPMKADPKVAEKLKIIMARHKIVKSELQEMKANL